MSLFESKDKQPTLDNFRPEIQGIRLLGALLVACFHIWGSGISGGVDVFFVISGYFLGYSQLQRINHGKPFSPLNHINRFINRTIPEVIAVLIACILITVLFLSPATWKENFTHILFSALYLENFWLIFQSADYLARNEDVSLVQHFWAISIIAQVYVSWILIIGLSKLSVKLFKQNLEFSLISILSILAIISFGWGAWFTSHQPEAAYFDPISRYWQFAAGAIAALFTHKISKSNVALSLLGFLLIISCGFVVGSTFKFPGFAALWPVTGAILVLLFSRNAKSVLTTTLSHPLIVKGGGLGFGVYLWHWPVYILFLRMTNTEPNLIEGILIILLSFVFAWWSAKLSTKNIKSLSKRSIILILGLFVVATTAFGARKIITSFPQVANTVVNQVYSSDITPGPLSNYLSLPESYALGCHISISNPTPKTCIFNENGKNGTVYLVGGSHAAHWLPALQALIEEKDFKIITATKSACTFADPEDSFLIDRGFHKSCVEWNKKVMTEIQQAQPDIVVVMGTRLIRENDKVEEVIPPAYLNNFKTLQAQNIQVLAIRDNPYMITNIPACVHKRNYQDTDCLGQRATLLDDQNFKAQKAKVNDWLFIADPMQHFCDQDNCYAVKDNIMIYRDAQHLTVEYSQTLAPWMSQQLDALNLKNRI